MPIFKILQEFKGQHFFVLLACNGGFNDGDDDGSELVRNFRCTISQF